MSIFKRGLLNKTQGGTTTNTTATVAVAPPVFTAEEKERIKAEIQLREELRREIESEKRSGCLASLINSPFVITVIGGLLIAGAGAYLQSNAARYEKQRAYRETLQDKKAILLRSFSSDFDQALALWEAYTVRHYWLQKTAHAKRPPVDDEGRTRDKVLQWQDDIWKSYVAHPQMGALLVQVEAIFDDKEVHDKVNGLRASMKKLNTVKSPTEKDLAPVMFELVTKRYEVTKAMAKEIRATVKPDDEPAFRIFWR